MIDTHTVHIHDVGNAVAYHIEGDYGFAVFGHYGTCEYVFFVAVFIISVGCSDSFYKVIRKVEAVVRKVGIKKHVAYLYGQVTGVGQTVNAAVTRSGTVHIDHIAHRNAQDHTVTVGDDIGKVCIFVDAHTIQIDNIGVAVAYHVKGDHGFAVFRHHGTRVDYVFITGVFVIVIVRAKFENRNSIGRNDKTIIGHIHTE